MMSFDLLIRITNRDVDDVIPPINLKLQVGNVSHMAQCDSNLLAGPQYTRNTWAMAHF